MIDKRRPNEGNTTLSKTLIVTNNPLVDATCAAYSGCEIRYVEGNVENLLIAVRDMVYAGHPLVSHPLPASIRMIYSPYRSVVMSASAELLDSWHAETIEESLRKYRQSAQHRARDETNAEAYKWMDAQLLSAALQEPIPFN